MSKLKKVWAADFETSYDENGNLQLLDKDGNKINECCGLWKSNTY